MQLVSDIKNNESGGNALNKAPRGFFDRLIDPSVLPLLIRLSQFLTGQNVPSYIVGGFIRDMLLERNTADIDIAVAGDALDIAERVASEYDGRFIPLDKVNRIARVLLTESEAPSPCNKCELDFSTLAGNIEEDLKKRDFTIDAMAIDLKGLKVGLESLKVIDPFGGRSDIEKGIIRAVTPAVFNEDAARMLRGIRLSYELGFTIDSNTEELIKRNSRLIAHVSGERIREELVQLLAVTEYGDIMPHLERLGLLTAIIPELAMEKGVEQPAEHFWDVFDHSLKTVRAADFLLRRGSWDYTGGGWVLDMVPWSTELEEHFNSGIGSGSIRRTMLKIAALFHDIAKPRTKAFDNNGRMRFLGHATEGATMASEIMERLRFSNREIKLVATMIKHHLRPTQVSQHGDLPTRRAVYRYFRDVGEAGIDIMFLSLADHLATRGPTLTIEGWREHTRIVDYVLSQQYEQNTMVTTPKLVDGDDLMNTFGLDPGPYIGELLEMVREAWASGALKTRDEALSYVRERLGNNTERK
jgi:poly(A) polymerase